MEKQQIDDIFYIAVGTFIILVVILIFGMMAFLIAEKIINNQTSEPEEPFIKKQAFINYTCSDGRRGFVSLEDWAEIKIPYDGCVGNYGYKCLNSNLIKWK